MSILFPAMLAGLAGLVIPVMLHLISRHKFPVQDFPSLRLLQAEERANVFAPRLVDRLQLLLRLLVLLLLVLAMSRLFAGCASSSPAPRNVVVVVDCSASMAMEVAKADGSGRTTLIELAKGRALQLLSEVAPPGQCAVIAAGQTASVMGGSLAPPDGSKHSSPSEWLAAVKPEDGTGRGLVHAVALACDMLKGRREARSQVVVLSDLRSSSLATRGQEDLRRIQRAREQLGASLDIVFVDVVSGVTENLAITDARVRGDQAKVGDDAHIIARIANMGAKEQTTRLRLAVADRQEPAAKEITLAPGAQAVVDMTTRVNRAVRTFAQVSIQPDALTLDDSFSTPLNVADPRRVLIVNGGGGGAGNSVSASALGKLGQDKQQTQTEPQETVDGATILRYVLNPGRELGLAYGTGIATTLISAEALGGQTLGTYDLFVLYDVSSLPESSLDDLESLVREGRSLLLIASGGCNAALFNRSLATAGGKHGSLSPVQLGNEKACDPPVAIRSDATMHAVAAPFRDRLQGDLSVIRFTKLRDLMSLNDKATPLFAASNGMPLGVEMPLGRGRVVLLTFGLELDRGNIARTRVFPTLIWRMVDYLTGRLKVRPPDVLTAQTPAVLDVSEPAFAFANELELTPVATGAPGGLGSTSQPTAPAGESIRLPVREDQTVLIEGLPAGRYLLHKARRQGEGAAIVSYSRPVSVHPDVRESDMKRADERDLASLFGQGVRTVNLAAVEPVPRGGEFWKALVALLLLAYVVEAITSWVLSARREKKRSLEAVK